MKSLKWLLCLLFFGFYVMAYSQKEFLPGYVLKNGIKMTGEIHNLSQYNLCSFKAEDGEIKDYSPGQIDEFGFDNGKVFKSGIVADNFAEFIVDGILEFYKCKDKFYLRKDKGEVYEIFANKAKNRLLENSEGKTVLVEDTKWKGIIIYLISDCNPKKTQVKDLKLKEAELTNLVIDYNKCKGSPYTYFKENVKKVEAKLGLNISADYNFISFLNAPLRFEYLIKGVAGFPGFSFGPHMDLYFPKVSNNLFFQLGLNYSTAKFSRETSFSKTFGTKAYNVQFNSQSIQLPVTINYDLFVNNLAIVPHIGMGANYNISNTGNLKSDEYTAPLDRHDFTDSELLFESVKINFHLEAGLGIRTKSGLGAKVTYQYLTPFFAITEFVNSNQSKFNFQLDYRF